jgi:hypothetical protein
MLEDVTYTHRDTHRKIDDCHIDEYGDFKMSQAIAAIDNRLQYM